MTLPLIGKTDNGSRGELVSDAYTGPVGFRRRGETLELAWPGKLETADTPMVGTLDGDPITITSIARSSVAPKVMLVAAATFG